MSLFTTTQEYIYSTAFNKGVNYNMDYYLCDRFNRPEPHRNTGFSMSHSLHYMSSQCFPNGEIFRRVMTHFPMAFIVFSLAVYDNHVFSIGNHR